MKASDFYRGPYAPSELIIMDESVYHLGIQNDEVAKNVILVGDPDRVEIISNYCDKQFSFRRSREFAISMNRIGNQDLTILSTGIGVDNIDIVLNELDAAVNVDFKTREQKSELTKLNIVRIGTSGAIHPSVEIGDFVASAYAIGMDAVPYHYQCELTDEEQGLVSALQKRLSWEPPLPTPYAAKCSGSLLDQIGGNMKKGITITANGFYGPQGRQVRLPLSKSDWIIESNDLVFDGYHLTNLEMECAGIYALGGMLGHEVLTCCVLLANRYEKRFVENPQERINALITEVLGRLT